jgi:hypothetical protein
MPRATKSRFLKPHLHNWQVTPASSWALKIDTHTNPVGVSQTVYVRSLSLHDGVDAISSKEYGAWQIKENAGQLEENRRIEFE